MFDRWLMRTYAVKRLILWRYLHHYKQAYFVTAFPKSGGTWLGQMLAGCTGLPFPRNNSVPKWENSILHGHLLPHESYDNVIVLIRDGRDCVVSLYYQYLFDNEWNMPKALKKIRMDLAFNDVDDIYENLPKFIEYLNGRYLRDGYLRITWSEFVDTWMDSKWPIVKYENLLTNAESELVGILGELKIDIPQRKVKSVVEKFEFKVVSGRDKGYENNSSFVRKGVAGGWVNSFSSEAKDVFKHFSGDQLIRAGYELNKDW